VFNDATVADLIASWPTTPSELLAVHGIGPTKAEQHGVAILAMLAEHDRPEGLEPPTPPMSAAVPTSTPAAQTPGRPVVPSSGPLHDRLRNWRRETAAERDVPLYRVLTNATIDALVDLRPIDADGLLAVSGIGPKTLEAHGPALLALINAD
jgi:ribonuclease D